MFNPQFQNLCCHHRHYCRMEVKLQLISFESYQNEIWANTSVLYNEHLWVGAGDWKLVTGRFMILLK